MKYITDNATFTYFRPLSRWTWKQNIKRCANQFILKVRMKITPPADPDQRKYNISICQIFKDEAPYLREWIEYHMMIGIDHFYFYDNNSSDGYESIIQPYIEKGIITLVKWPKEHAQVEAYEDCIRRFRNESDWIGFIDVDEFIVPVAENSFPKFLNRFSKKPAVLIYWRVFNSGGMVDRDLNGLVIEDFVVASEKLYNKGKCFYNTHYDYLWNDPKNKSMFHILWTSVNNTPVPPVDIFNRFITDSYYPAAKKAIPVQLNHYTLKSYMEHKEKDKKGDVYFSKPSHNDELFFARELRCSTADYQIYKFLTQLKLRLQKDPGQTIDDSSNSQKE